MLNPSLRKIIKKIIVTEKTHKMTDTVCFLVDTAATKQLIKSAVEQIFNVNVTNVNTCMGRKSVKQPGRQQHRLASIKKAYVKIQSGQEISIDQSIKG